MTPELDSVIRVVTKNCMACQSSFLPNPPQIYQLAMSIPLNEEIEIDISYFGMNDSQPYVLHLVECGTKYSERAFIKDRTAAKTISTIYRPWCFRFEAPVHISGDDEFNRSAIVRVRHITLKPRPSPRHNKLGTVEPKPVP